MRFFLLSSAFSFAFAQHGINPVPIGAMRVQGNHIVDSTGQTIVLRGAEIPGLNLPSLTPELQQALAPTTFSTMRQRYNMNALRLPVSSTVAASDPQYLTRVATVVRQANAAGMVAILAEYGDGPLIPFWTAVASYFKDNPLTIFDVYNDPPSADWNAWLHGSDSFVGMQALVNAIRSTGATQIIAVQGLDDLPEFQGFNAFVPDPNIVYEVHPWFSKDVTDADRDAHFGFLASQVPVLAGEWGFVPGADSANCRALPGDPDGAEQVINSALDYFERHGISWIYATFLPGNLYIDYTDYYRTDLTSSWTCNGNTPVGLGIGETLQYYLDGLKEGDLVPVSGAAGNIVGSARGSVVHIYGYEMSAQTEESFGTPPVSLGGISVQIIDSSGVAMLAPLLYVSPFLVNAVIPASTAPGIAEFQILGGLSDGLKGPALIEDVQPGIFTGPANGRGPVIGFADGNPIWQCSDSGCSTVAIPRDAMTLSLTGAGIRNAKGPVTATIGGFDVPVLYAGAQDENRGIDEIDLRITDQVRGLGETDLLVFADGIPSNAVRINLAAQQ